MLDIAIEGSLLCQGWASAVDPDTNLAGVHCAGGVWVTCPACTRKPLPSYPLHLLCMLFQDMCNQPAQQVHVMHRT